MISGSFFSLLVYFYLLYDGMHAIVLPTDKWDTHKLRYGLLFEPTEDETRKTIFEDNMRYIERINAANLTFKLEMNHLGHMSVQELVKGINHEALKAKYPSEGDYHIDTKLKSSDPEPTEIDWRKVDAVSPVKNQGRCGSCWAFSTTGALEAQYRLKHGVMKTFSEQQLVDCDTQNIDQGCDGGLPVAAFEYLREVGLVEEKKYPYVASRNIECELNKNENSLQNTTKIRSYAVLAMDEKELTSAIYKIGPISVAIDAGSRAFQFYKSGIYQDPTCGSDVNSLNHAVLAVGYGYDKFLKGNSTSLRTAGQHNGVKMGISEWFEIRIIIVESPPSLLIQFCETSTIDICCPMNHITPIFSLLISFRTFSLTPIYIVIIVFQCFYTTTF